MTSCTCAVRLPATSSFPLGGMGGGEGGTGSSGPQNQFTYRAPKGLEGSRFNELVSWCSEPSQPQRVTSGLKSMKNKSNNNKKNEHLHARRTRLRSNFDGRRVSKEEQEQGGVGGKDYDGYDDDDDDDDEGETKETCT